MSQAVAFVIWLLCVGISAVLIGYFLKNSLKPVIREGFAVKTCPAGTNSFVTNSGETQCCNGDVVDNYCTGNLRCTLSPKSKSGLPTCTDLAASDAAAAGANRCPPSMSHYFGCPTTVEGCSSSPPSANGLQPSNPLQPQCILYKTQAEDLVKLDSCYNVMQNSQKEARCAVAEATANLPACARAAADASAPSSASGGTCSPPPISSFVIYGDWISGGRIPVQQRFIQANGNIVYAIQQGQHVKMVVTDKNNITITARNYVGLISDLNSRASDMSKINAMGDSSGHYILASAS
jgi:hypothetical protein